MMLTENNIDITDQTRSQVVPCCDQQQSELQTNVAFNQLRDLQRLDKGQNTAISTQRVHSSALKDIRDMRDKFDNKQAKMTVDKGTTADEVRNSARAV